MQNTSTKINMDNINWKAEKSSLVPIYKQIIDFIKTKISSGEWSIGNRLPTQVSIAKAFNVNISTMAKEVDAYVLSDEADRGLNHTGNRFTKSIVDLYNKGISTSSISKTFALAGVRIG